MQTIKIKLTGITPYLQTRYPIEDLAPFVGKSGRLEKPSKIKREPDPQADFEKLMYRDTEGKVFIPAAQIRMALVGAASQIKKGKGTYSASFGSGSVIVCSERIYLPEEMQTPAVQIDSAVGKVGRIVLARPAFFPWEAAFEVEYDENDVTEDVLRNAFDIAGKKYGIGAWRPQKKGPHGRFRVDLFENVTPETK